MAAIGKSRKTSRTMARKSKKNLTNLAIGGGLALLAEKFFLDSVVNTKMAAYAQTAAGVAGYFFLKNPILKGTSVVLGAHGAYKAFAGSNLLTGAQITGVSPYYRISGTGTVERLENNPESGF